MRYGNSGCLTGIVAAFSRIMLLMLWFARPVMMDAAFGSFIIPCLGFLFVPFTTLVYVFLIQGVGRIQGLDWLWLILAFIMDIASIGAAGAANRNRIPAGYPGSYAEKELSAASSTQPSAVTPPGPAPVPAPAPVSPAQPTAATPAAPDQPTESNPQ